MNDKLKELIQPYWVEEQQGVYIPLIDKVLHMTVMAIR